MSDFDVALETSEINVTLVLERTVNSGEGSTGPIGWDDVEDKPTTFPPAVHNHDDRYYTETEIDAIVAGIDEFSGAYSDLTGKPTQDEILDGTTYKQYSQTEKTKLAGIATGATANDTDANLKARANHTGTQLAATISDFNASVDARTIKLAPFTTPNNSYFNLAQRGAGGVGHTATTPSGSTANSNNLVFYAPFVIDEVMTIDALAQYVNLANAGASAVLRLGIYADNNGVPGTLIIDAGTASINSPGVKTLTFTGIQFQKGRYWYAAVMQNLDKAGANPQFSCATSSFSTIAEDTIQASSSQTVQPRTTGISGAFANNPTITKARNISTAQPPNVWARVASTP